jgi:predicted deacylase
LVVTAGVHGDEYEGIEAIARLYQQIEPAQLRGKLVLVPVCNMAAYEAVQRSSPIDGLNLARTFPGDASGTITQRIAHWITEQLLRHADFYIDLHSGGVAYDIPTLIGYIHDAGELGQRSRAAAAAFGAPVLWGHPLPMPPGRTISAATDLGVPSLYSEAPGGGYARPADVAIFAQGVINVMRHLGIIAGDPAPQPCTHDLFGDGNLDVVTAAPVAGYFRAAVALLDEVVTGQPLGAIYDFAGAVLAEVLSERDGVVIMLRRIHRVQVGEGLAQVTGWL